MAEDRWVELTLREPRGMRILGKLQGVNESIVTGASCVCLTDPIRMGEEMVAQQREIQHEGQKMVVPDVRPLPYHMPVTLLYPRFAREAAVEIPVSNVSMIVIVDGDTVAKFRSELMGSNIKPVRLVQ